MVRNGRDIASGSEVSAQVCIIGSGPAGITAAWHLQKAGFKAVLIEGSRDYGTQWKDSWPDKTRLYGGQAVGLFASNEPEFLILPYGGNQNSAWERERVFGGTSVHWGGQSRPLDPIDFEARPGFPGWPVNRADLDPWYAAAASFCNLHGDDFSADYWAGVLGAEVPKLQDFDVCMYQFMGGDYLNFATRTFPGGSTIGDSPVDIILNASLLGIEHQQGSVRRLRVASMDDGASPKPATEFTVRADTYVLACGAVANAHALLVSDAGNEHDQVGRYFMCHPLSDPGVVQVSGSYLDPAESRLMGGQTPTGEWRDANGVRVNARFTPDAEAALRLGIGRCWFWANYSQYYFEMSPNPDSRITLASSFDPVFGQAQARIDWQLSPRDQTTYEQTTKLFSDAVGQRGGQVYAASWDAVQPTLVVNGHHIGTTRMSSDPADGVVDANLKVHGLDNLHVAGSSVFRTTGVSNPTFTIIALSIRLADHLRQTLGK